MFLTPQQTPTSSILNTSTQNTPELSAELRNLLYGGENAISFLQNKRGSQLLTGIDAFDKDIKGGLVRGDVVEIYAESGVGTSQILLSMCAACILPYGFRKLRFKSVPEGSTGEGFHHVLYFDVDDKISILRLTGILEMKIKKSIHQLLMEERNKGVIEFDEELMVVDDEVTWKAFGGHESYSEFIKTCLSRVKVINVRSAFQWWMTIEALIERNNEHLTEPEVDDQENYRIVFVDSLNVFSKSECLHHSDWLQCVSSLIKYANKCNMTLIAVKREDAFTKESRRKYHKSYFSKQDQFTYTHDQRLINELTMVHRETMPKNWSERVNYRVLLDKPSRGSGNDASSMVLQCTQTNMKPTKVYKYWIDDSGVFFN
ncbi:DNA-repair protein XRCC2 [Acrasis kona]|uniref:DNA-repair protein XRCC2 n=1 Tax=Acrasis kona TaxID=1008807 RepID=A0AAW2YLK1_9EUKA